MDKDKLIGWSIISGIIIVAIVIISFAIYSAQIKTYEITGTVEKKWIDVGDDESYYLLRVTLEDNTSKMLEVNRNIFHGGSYNPDIVYSDIQENHTYVFTCWGWDWQWAWVYWYPMVIIAEEVP